MFNHSKTQFQSTQHLSKHYKCIFHLVFNHFFHTISSKEIITLFNLQSGIKRHYSTTKVGSNLYYNLFRYTKYPMKNWYFDSRLLLNFMLSAAQEATGCSFNAAWILGEGQGNSQLCVISINWLFFPIKYLRICFELNEI